METIDTNELIYLTKCGNIEAFDSLYRYYRPRISTMILKHHGSSIDIYDYEELTLIGMEEFDKLIFSYRMDRDDNFSTYVYNCINKRMISIKRKRKETYLSLDMTINDESQRTFLEQIPDEKIAFKPEDQLIVRESLIHIKRKAMLVLSSEELKIFKLYIKGYDASQISYTLHLSKKNVSNKVYRILKKLRN